MLRRLLSLLLLLPGALPAMAGSVQSPVQSVKLAYGQQQALLHFSADTPFRKAKPLCECTKVTLSGRQLTAVVDTSAFSQDMEKQIDVTLADGTTTRLTMRFSVPQALVLSSRSLIWPQGSPAQPKELHIRVPAGSPIHRVVEASLSGDAFDFTPRVVKEGSEYIVSVTPRSTDKKLLNRLIIQTDSTEPRYARYIIYLSIHPL